MAVQSLRPCPPTVGELRSQMPCGVAKKKKKKKIKSYKRIDIYVCVCVFKFSSTIQ